MGYNQQIYQKVTDELARRRDVALSTAQAHMDDLHARSPEAAELDTALSQTANRIFEAAKSKTDLERKLAAIQHENEDLLAARRELLTSLNLPADYTDPHYTCPHCSDTGYVMATMCTCMKKMLRLESLRGSCVANADTQTFETFSLDYYRDSEKHYNRMKTNLEVAQEFAENFSHASGNLLLLGATGLGKTHLSTAIARCVIEKGFDVIYDTVQALCADYEHDRFYNNRNSYSNRTEKYLNTDLLIIDDLGSEFITKFSISCLYQVVNTRLVRSLPTIISTNFTVNEITTEYDSRLGSRLLGTYSVLLFEGQDIRLQKLLKK